MTVPKSPAQLIRKLAKDHHLEPEDLAVLCRNYSKGRTDTPEQMTAPEIVEMHWDLPAFAASPARMDRARQTVAGTVQPEPRCPAGVCARCVAALPCDPLCRTCHPREWKAAS